MSLKGGLGVPRTGQPAGRREVEEGLCVVRARHGASRRRTFGLLATSDPGPGSAAPGSRSARKPTETGGSYAPGGRPAAPSGRALWAFRHRRVAGARRNGRGLLSARYRIEPRGRREIPVVAETGQFGNRRALDPGGP